MIYYLDAIIFHSFVLEALQQEEKSASPPRMQLFKDQDLKELICEMMSAERDKQENNDVHSNLEKILCINRHEVNNNQIDFLAVFPILNLMHSRPKCFSEKNITKFGIEKFIKDIKTFKTLPPPNNRNKRKAFNDKCDNIRKILERATFIKDKVLTDFEKVINIINQSHVIEAITLNIHNTYEMCYSCAPDLAVESVRSGGFADYFIDSISKKQSGEKPFFCIVASCRKLREDKWCTDCKGPPSSIDNNGSKGKEPASENSLPILQDPHKQPIKFYQHLMHEPSPSLGEAGPPDFNADSADDLSSSNQGQTTWPEDTLTAEDCTLQSLRQENDDCGLPIRSTPLNTVPSQFPEETYTIGTQTFYLQNVSGAGMRCFFNAVGLNPQDVIHQFKQQCNDPLVRAMVANEIVSAALTHEELPEALKEAIHFSYYKGVMKELDMLDEKRSMALKAQSEDPEQQDPNKLSPLLKSIDKKRTDLMNDMRTEACTMEAYKAFVEYHLAGGEMMVLLPDVQGDNETGQRTEYTSIDAVAYLNKIGLKIYAPNGTGSLRLLHSFIPEGAIRVVYLYHEGVHFQALIPCGSQ